MADGLSLADCGDHQTVKDACYKMRWWYLSHSDCRVAKKAVMCEKAKQKRECVFKQHKGRVHGVRASSGWPQVSVPHSVVVYRRILLRILSVRVELWEIKCDQFCTVLGRCAWSSLECSALRNHAACNTELYKGTDFYLGSELKLTPIRPAAGRLI